MSVLSGEKKNNLLRRIAICVQYDGSEYSGWQKQKSSKSVQEIIERVIAELDPHRPVKAIAAGRTDAGVHAAGQVIHFDSTGHIPPKRWAKALNGRLPSSIRVRESVLMPQDWHACHSAIYRRYRYTIFNGRSPNLFLEKWSWHRYSYRLDEKLMKIGLSQLHGFHDFAAFQKAGSNRSHSWTTIQEVELERTGDLISIDVQASGFLYGMVRLLVGQLVAIGEHRLDLDEFENRWRNCLRSQVRESAPAHGLCLIRAGYSDFVFSESSWFDTFPKFKLSGIDSPEMP